MFQSSASRVFVSCTHFTQPRLKLILPNPRPCISQSIPKPSSLLSPRHTSLHRHYSSPSSSSSSFGNLDPQNPGPVLSSKHDFRFRLINQALSDHKLDNFCEFFKSERIHDHLLRSFSFDDWTWVVGATGGLSPEEVIRVHSSFHELCLIKKKKYQKKITPTEVAKVEARVKAAKTREQLLEARHAAKDRFQKEVRHKELNLALATIPPSPEAVELRVKAEKQYGWNDAILPDLIAAHPSLRQLTFPSHQELEPTGFVFAAAKATFRGYIKYCIPPVLITLFLRKIADQAHRVASHLKPDEVFAELNRLNLPIPSLGDSFHMERGVRLTLDILAKMPKDSKWLVTTNGMGGYALKSLDGFTSPNET